MTDRKVTVNEADLRWVLSYVTTTPPGLATRLRAALDALDAEAKETNR